MSEKEELSVVSDQIGCPTNAKGLAEFLWQLAEQEELESIYHYSDLGVASWYDFSVAIQDIAYDEGKLIKKIPIRAISSTQYPTPAKRPTYSVIRNCVDTENWRKNLIRCLAFL